MNSLGTSLVADKMGNEARSAPGASAVRVPQRGHVYLSYSFGAEPTPLRAQLSKLMHRILKWSQPEGVRVGDRCRTPSFVNKGEELGAIVERTLDQTYYVKYRSTTLRFVAANSELIGILLSTGKQLRQYFGNSELYLSYYADPEEDKAGLRVEICTTLDPSNAYELLDKFDDEIWLRSERRFTDRILITLSAK